MDFYKVLLQIMNERSLTIPDVSRATGLSDSTIRSIISRKTKNITLEVAFKISKGLDVSLERLNGENFSASNFIDKLKIDETKLLTNYNMLNDIGKKEANKRVAELTCIPMYSDSEVTATKTLEGMSDTIAAHDDDLTPEEKEEMDKRILERLKKLK